MNIRLLQNGGPKYNLYLIRGLNSKNDFSAWKLDELNFPGNIFGLEWESDWDEWKLVEEKSTNKILAGIVNFGIGYLNVCNKADIAGKYLAKNIKYKIDNYNYIFSHSMGTRAAFTFLKHASNKFFNNQVFLFNGAVPYSDVSHNFNLYSGIAKNGIVNLYNPDDPLLYVLSMVRNAGQKSLEKTAELLLKFDFLKNNLKKFEETFLDIDFILGNKRNLNSIAKNIRLSELSRFFEPVGLYNSKTVPENYSLRLVQGKDHGIDNIFPKVIRFDLERKKFSILTESLNTRESLEDKLQEKNDLEEITRLGKKLLSDIKKSITVIKQTGKTK